MTTELGELLVYQAEDGQAAVDVQLKDETVWLTLNQLAELFVRDKSVISRHLRNIFQSGELEREAAVAKNATTAADGKTYQVDYYNLDAIISVGYRVNSKRGTQFRIWATNILKQHLVQGYSLNRQRLAEKGIAEIRRILELLTNTLENHNLVNEDGRAVLTLIKNYARTWQLLWQYDEDSLPMPGGTAGVFSEVPELDQIREAVASLRRELILVALTLLIASSAPEQKDLLIRLVVNLITDTSKT